MNPTGHDLAKLIDHTLLKPEATAADIQKLCEEAKTYGFATVCIYPMWLTLASKILSNSRVQPIAVVGFSSGATTSESKAFETRQAVHCGAQEIDMVLAIGALKSGDERHVLNDIRQVVEAAEGHPVKVILETALLTPTEIILACQLSQKAGAAFVKTSTGFGPSGATVEAVRLMRETVGPTMGVKASGGIRTYADALRMIQAGANRIGASVSVAIIQESIQSKSETSVLQKNGKTDKHSSQY